MRRICGCVLGFAACVWGAAPHQPTLTMHATAYSKHGLTSSGTKPHRGIIAADSRVLPPGSKVQVKNAGPYSGVYKVRDTGGAIRGHRIDIYTPSKRAAHQFGAHTVQVKVLKRAAPRN
jgi:3D (Asp-Asp-Asp) domain-containing protein